MTLQLDDFFDVDTLQEMINDGYISATRHPTLPLTILNYTNKTMWESKWTEETIWCRGLIFENDTKDVIAMGPKKFFNYGQEGEEPTSLESEVLVTKKLDGSLGIVWNYRGEWGVATRGSFTSDQALHATNLLMDSKYDHLRVDSTFGTVVVEIIYPSNRVVVDYGDTDDLKMLGFVSPVDGEICKRPDNIIVNKFYTTMADALALPIPDDEEGFVLDILDFNRNTVGHVKLKGDKYKELHRIMTGLSARRVWEMMLARFIAKTGTKISNIPGVSAASLSKLDVSKGILEMLGDVPDEFSDWVKDKISSINSAVDASVWNDISLSIKLKSFPDGRERFEAGRHNPHIGAILSYLRTDNPTQIHMEAWKDARPGVELPFTTDSDG